MKLGAGGIMRRRSASEIKLERGRASDAREEFGCGEGIVDVIKSKM